MNAETAQRAFDDLNQRMLQQEATLAQLGLENQQLTHRLAAATPVGKSGSTREHGLVDTRILGKPDQFAGDGMKYPDWSFKLKSYMGAVDVRYQALMLSCENSTVPVLNAIMSGEEAQLSTQLFYVLVMLTSGSALDKCHNCGVNEGFEAWRSFAMEYEPKLKTRTVGMLMQVLGFKFGGNVAARLDAFERAIHEYESQSKEKVTDDTRIGIVMLGMEDLKIKEHLIRNSSRLGTWAARGDPRGDEDPALHGLAADADAARSRSRQGERQEREQQQRQRQEGKRQVRRQGQQGQGEEQGRQRHRQREDVLLLRQDGPHEERVPQAAKRRRVRRGQTDGRDGRDQREDGGDCREAAVEPDERQPADLPSGSSQRPRAAIVQRRAGPTTGISTEVPAPTDPPDTPVIPQPRATTKLEPYQWLDYHGKVGNK